MTMTSVVFGIAMLGTPEPPPDWDCARPAAGSTAAIRNGIMNFISLSPYLLILSIQSVCLFGLFTRKDDARNFLAFNEKLYEKIPRLHQHLVTLFRRQSHADTRQHTGHAGE